MSIYRCNKCEAWFDDDYEPMSELGMCGECQAEFDEAFERSDREIKEVGRLINLERSLTKNAKKE